MKNMEMVLAELGVPVDRARRFGSHIEYALNRFGIADTDTIAIFLANVLIETGGFSRLRENMNYTTVENLKRVFPSYFKTVDPKPYVSNPEKLANYVYANRNGNTQPGDGWRFRGGGMLQLTGRSQYNAANACLRGKFDIIKNPDDITTPRCAAVVSVQYFKMNHLDDLLRRTPRRGQKWCATESTPAVRAFLPTS